MSAPGTAPVFGVRAVPTARGGASVRVKLCELVPRPDGAREWRTYGVLQMPAASWVALRAALRKGCRAVGPSLAEDHA